MVEVYDVLGIVLSPCKFVACMTFGACGGSVELCMISMPWRMGICQKLSGFGLVCEAYVHVMTLELTVCVALVKNAG